MQATIGTECVLLASLSLAFEDVPWAAWSTADNVISQTCR